MRDVLFAVLLVGGIGLLIGIILAVASIIFAVPKDEKAEAIAEVLPGANCGACGFSGCAGYAKALSEGKAKVGLCSPGGEETAKAVAALLGVEAGSMEKTAAVVHCMGSEDKTERKMDYRGIKTCAAAAMMYGGTGKCSYGCMGFGDCAAVCEYDAVRICNSVAQIDKDKCRACSKCVEACPHGLISILPVKRQAVVKCSNCDKGAQTRKDCKVGCIGCMKCVKVCKSGAVRIENLHAVVDPAKCTGCAMCEQECPQKCIIVL